MLHALTICGDSKGNYMGSMYNPPCLREHILMCWLLLLIQLLTWYSATPLQSV